MPKNKSHKGTLKRVRITATGKIKMQRAFGRHLRSHKSGSLIRKYRLPAYAQGPDEQRLRRLLGLKVHTRKKGPTPAASAGAERS
ncbi:MAG: 50S ribosomal protein L35 [Planctomycetota bacterium]|jgi:large subunit ribosomal protein L35